MLHYSALMKKEARTSNENNNKRSEFGAALEHVPCQFKKFQLRKQAFLLDATSPNWQSEGSARWSADSKGACSAVC